MSLIVMEPTQEIIRFVAGGREERVRDAVAVEEPLEMRLVAGPGEPMGRSLAITMRTPGDDRALAAGFLVSEGIIRSRGDLIAVESCGPVIDGWQNTVKATLADDARIDWQKLERHFYATSSCGVCGKSSLAALEVQGVEPLPRGSWRVTVATLLGLSEAVMSQQTLFRQTGGLHGAALFTADGELVSLAEDVGRHNAVDKLIGAAFLEGMWPLDDRLLFLSGRAGFELVQKALVARIPVVAAVGAPSSLAVSLARANGMTLIGFLREGRFNVYSGDERIVRP